MAFASELDELCTVWPCSPLLGHKQLKRKELKDASFPEAKGCRGRWNLGLKPEEQQRQNMKQEEKRQRRAFQAPEEMQGPVENREQR